MSSSLKSGFKIVPANTSLFDAGIFTYANQEKKVENYIFLLYQAYLFYNFDFLLTV